LGCGTLSVGLGVVAIFLVLLLGNALGGLQILLLMIALQAPVFLLIRKWLPKVDREERDPD
jgi:hypothetical protein